MDVLEAPVNSQTAPLRRLSRWSESIEGYVSRFLDLLERRKHFFIAIFCVTYGLLTLYRASRKLFWFDEIFTIYLSQLSDPTALWNALLQGTDFNPLPFYWLTRFSQFLFGVGNIGTRLPEIVGFGIFCLCIFRFVSLRSSVLAGAIAMLFPLITIAYWYADDARPYSLVFAFGGLALVCWQGAAAQERQRFWWLLGLGAALFGGLVMHAYAVLLFVPIGAGELARAWSRKRPDWPMWATVALSFLGFAPLLMLQRVAAVTLPYDNPPLTEVMNTYASDIAPAAMTIGLTWILISFGHIMRRGQNSPLPRYAVAKHSYETICLVVCTLLPVAAYAVSKTTGTFYVPRYSLFMVAGLAGIVGILAEKNSITGLAVLFVFVLQIGFDFIRDVRNSFVREPTIGLRLSTDVDQFMQRYALMSTAEDHVLPIVLLDNLEFAQTFYYAPPTLASRLVYLTPQGGLSGVSVTYAKLRSCCNAPGNTFPEEEFISSHDSFLAYGSNRSAYHIGMFIQAGGAVTFKRTADDHFLVSVAFKRSMGARSN